MYDSGQAPYLFVILFVGKVHLSRFSEQLSVGQATSAESGLHAGTVKFSTQNEDRISTGIVICV